MLLFIVKSSLQCATEIINSIERKITKNEKPLSRIYISLVIIIIIIIKTICNAHIVNG